MRKLLNIVAVAVVTGLAVPAVGWTQADTSTPAATEGGAKKAGGGKKAGAVKAGTPINGKITAVDTEAKTVTIKATGGDVTVKVTTATKIKKADGTDGAIEDLKVGEMVRGHATDVSGSKEATALNLGAAGAKGGKGGKGGKGNKDEAAPQ